MTRGLLVAFGGVTRVALTTACVPPVRESLRVIGARDQIQKLVAADAGDKILLAQLAQARSPSQLSTALLAVSNSGSSALFAAAVERQTHADPQVRTAAIQAIRLMPQAEPRLRELLGRKHRGDVETALHAFGRRPHATRESVDRIESLAKNDPDASIRREAVLVLQAWSKDWPALVPVLARIHERDADERVRDVAKPTASP